MLEWDRASDVILRRHFPKAFAWICPKGSCLKKLLSCRDALAVFTVDLRKTNSITTITRVLRVCFVIFSDGVYRWASATAVLGECFKARISDKWRGHQFFFLFCARLPVRAIWLLIEVLDSLGHMMATEHTIPGTLACQAMFIHSVYLSARYLPHLSIVIRAELGGPEMNKATTFCIESN